MFLLFWPTWDRCWVLQPPAICGTLPAVVKANLSSPRDKLWPFLPHLPGAIWEDFCDFLRISRPGPRFSPSGHLLGSIGRPGRPPGPKQGAVSIMLGIHLEVIFGTLGTKCALSLFFCCFLQGSVQGARFLFVLGRPGDPRTHKI